MRRLVLLVVLAAACGDVRSTPDARIAPVASGSRDAAAAAGAPSPDDATAVSAAPAAPRPGHDFTPIGRDLLAVGACGGGPAPIETPAEIVRAHCAEIVPARETYRARWVAPAATFFAEKLPAGLPRAVVYPFSGGDLSTALTVFPDADEITTLSLEPAGDPRTLAALARRPAELRRALAAVASTLTSLYRVGFSNTDDMIDAMRGGELPTLVVFALSALVVHGDELVSLRYFTLDEAGAIRYLDDDDLARAPTVAAGRPGDRNRVFANAELEFRRPGGPVQVYRHIQANLDDAHLAADPRVVRHLAAKGAVVALTKAASYLLAWDSFSTIRGYLLDHVAWMASDATGVAPRWGTPAGFTYETYGRFDGPHLGAGPGIAASWRAAFAAHPHRRLAFRFGYLDRRRARHLVLMSRRPASPP